MENDVEAISDPLNAQTNDLSPTDTERGRARSTRDAMALWGCITKDKRHPSVISRIESALSIVHHSPLVEIGGEMGLCISTVRVCLVCVQDRDEAITLTKAMDVVMGEIGAPLSIRTPPITPQPDQSRESEAKAIEELRE